MDRNAKRRKITQNSSPSSILGNGCKGVLLTCDRGKENLAAQEIYKLLDEYIEKHYGNILDDTKEPKEQEENSNPEGRNDLSTQLDEEIKQLKQSKSRKNYSRIDIGVKAVVFIRILLEEVDPVVIVQDIFTTSKKENKSLVRYCARLIPVQRTCYAHVEDVVKNIKEMIPTVFTESNKGTNWYSRIVVRNNNVFSKQDCINELVSLLEPDYPSDYKNPSIAINIEVNKGTASLAILPNWSSMNDLSLRTLLVTKPPKEEKPKEKQEKQYKLDEDWKCPSCDAPNFKTISVCWKCKQPRIPTSQKENQPDKEEKSAEKESSSESEEEFHLFG